VSDLWEGFRAIGAPYLQPEYYSITVVSPNKLSGKSQRDSAQSYVFTDRQTQQIISILRP